MGASLRLCAADRREYSDQENHQRDLISRNHTDKMNARCCIPMRMQIAGVVGDLILHGELSVDDDRSLKPSNNLCRSGVAAQLVALGLIEPVEPNGIRRVGL
jgi:hypothetical protein